MEKIRCGFLECAQWVERSQIQNYRCPICAHPFWQLVPAEASPGTALRIHMVSCREVRKGDDLDRVVQQSKASWQQWWPEGFQEISRHSPRDKKFVAVEESELVGVVEITQALQDPDNANMEEIPRRAILSSLFVVPQLQRKGVGCKEKEWEAVC